MLAHQVTAAQVLQPTFERWSAATPVATETAAAAVVGPTGAATVSPAVTPTAAGGIRAFAGAAAIVPLTAVAAPTAKATSVTSRYRTTIKASPSRCC